MRYFVRREERRTYRDERREARNSPVESHSLRPRARPSRSQVPSSDRSRWCRLPPNPSRKLAAWMSMLGNGARNGVVRDCDSRRRRVGASLFRRPDLTANQFQLLVITLKPCYTSNTAPQRILSVFYHSTGWRYASQIRPLPFPIIWLGEKSKL